MSVGRRRVPAMTQVQAAGLMVSGPVILAMATYGGTALGLPLFLTSTLGVAYWLGAVWLARRSPFKPGR